MSNDSDPTAAQIVASEYEGYLPSDRLDPTWIAGWHAAINHATAVLSRDPARKVAFPCGECDTEAEHYAALRHVAGDPWWDEASR